MAKAAGARIWNPANICFRFQQPTNSQDIATPVWEAATQGIYITGMGTINHHDDDRIIHIYEHHHHDHDCIVHRWWRSSSWSWFHCAWMTMIALYMDDDECHHDHDQIVHRWWGSYCAWVMMDPSCPKKVVLAYVRTLETGSPDHPFRCLDKKHDKLPTNIPTTLIIPTRVNGIVLWNEIVLWIFNFVVSCHICMWFALAPSHLVWVHIWKPLSSAFIHILKCVDSSALNGWLSRARLSP